MLLRTKKYAIANAKLVLSLPANIVTRNYAHQLNRSESSTGVKLKGRLSSQVKSTFH